MQHLSISTWLAAALLLLTAGSLPTPAATITVLPSPAFAGNQAAISALNRAAQSWERVLLDPIQVTLDADLLPLGSGVVGSTSPFELTAGFNFVRDLMVADAADELDDTIVGLLPSATVFSTYLPPGFGVSGNVQVTKANLKALGFATADEMFGVSDGVIKFNTGFLYDYDSSDGVSEGHIDFQTVATHEIGHALGFLSAVDVIDAGITTASTTTLDMFRFRAIDIVTRMNFATEPRTLLVGDESVFFDGQSRFSFSTGKKQGDGSQAGHWEDDEFTGFLIGIHDPTLPAGQRASITYADLRALDVIGWDVDLPRVPEPGTWTLMAAGLVGCIWLHRRRTP